MKKIIFLLVMVSCVALTSCNGSGDNASKRVINPAPQATNDSVVTDTSATENVAPPAAPAATPAAQQTTPQTSKEAPRPVKPESSTDKLLKQYNEVFVNLVLDKQAGKEIDTKKIFELKSQLEQLDKKGALDATQKELFQVTNDAFDKFMKK